MCIVAASLAAVIGCEGDSNTNDTTSSSSGDMSSSSGAMGGSGGGMIGANFSATIADDATFIDCSQTGANQLGGTAFVNFQNDTGSVQTALLTKATTHFANGANTMDMTLDVQWSTSNPGTANQIPPGTSNSVIYKEQTGAPAPVKNPCDFCPFMGGNGNTQPTLTPMLEWDVNGTTVTAVSNPELKFCL